MIEKNSFKNVHTSKSEEAATFIFYAMTMLQDFKKISLKIQANQKPNKIFLNIQ